MDYITIKGARENNLKNIDLKLPRNKLIVITGLSGSGKSSLAFDTIYSEGQRRYLESFSSYARNFLDKMSKADVDFISGLSPSISIEQRQMTRNPRSTVGTVTEIYDYMRLLFAKVGDLHCHKCGGPVGGQNREEIKRRVLSIGKDIRMTVYAPLVRERKGEYKDLLKKMRAKGFSKIRVDGEILDLTETDKLKKSKRHTIDVIVDRLRLKEGADSRIGEAVNLALDVSDGLVLAVDEETGSEYLYSEKRACPKCSINYGEITPNMFSFNSPYGACPECHGLGQVSRLAASHVIKDPSKPILRGALNKDIFIHNNKYAIEDLVIDLSKLYGFELKTRYCDLDDAVKDAFLWGDAETVGVVDLLVEQFQKTGSENQRNKIARFLIKDTCPECNGARIKKESLGVFLNGKNIYDLCRADIGDLHVFFQQYESPVSKEKIARPILREIRERLSFLVDIGVNYLSLERSVSTLGGGELQRVKLGSQIGVGLSGVLYVLDEPSIGLHPRDTDKLINSLLRLRDLNNTVIVVEHDEETIMQADYIVDIGPAAGIGGGKIVARGKRDAFLKNKRSLTSAYLRGDVSIPVPEKRVPYKGAKGIQVIGAEEHNLKSIDVTFPLGLFTCVTGVSGSGKSTLVHDILSRELHNRRWKTSYKVGKHKEIKGAENIDKLIEIDQSPIGRTPRSNPATYVDIFVHIRKLFAMMPEAKLRSYTQSRFSFNLKGGRCETCRGEGYEKLEMSFLPSVYVRCEDCKGKRYNDETLAITYKGKNISEVLEMSIGEALEFFDAVPVIREKLQVLVDVGLSYLKLGQPSTTLSGGEAQRVKLASELSKRSTGKTLYVLDEPTTGLHFDDIKKLMKAILALRDAGNTIIIIEHNLDVIKMADYLVDLGPEGGKGGGELIRCGSPEEIAADPNSRTGKYLRKYLKA